MPDVPPEGHTFPKDEPLPEGVVQPFDRPEDDFRNKVETTENKEETTEETTDPANGTEEYQGNG